MGFGLPELSFSIKMYINHTNFLSYLMLRDLTIKNFPILKMTKQSDSTVEEDLKELLKRCPEGTYEAALTFRKNKDVSQVETIVMGIIDRHLEPEQREILADSDDTLRMYEDLGMDSLTMLEVVMLVEQTLEVSIDNEELRDLRTIGDVKVYLNAKARGEEPPKRLKTYRVEEIASLMPHKEPFMFLESASISGNTATARYKISGNEYFLEGHFKDNPLTPGVILTEVMAQIGVVCLGIYLLKKFLSEIERPQIALSNSEVDFFLPVKPKERVKVVSEKIYFRFNKLKCKVLLFNEKNKLVCRGTISGMLKILKNET